MKSPKSAGASDRVKELPTLAQRVDDLRAVLDEVGSERAVLVGVSEGGPLSIAFSVERLQLVSSVENQLDKLPVPLQLERAGRRVPCAREYAGA